MSGPVDIHAYLAEFDDIPGTRVFTAARARQGYHLNQFAMSLMKPANRESWRAGERGELPGGGVAFDWSKTHLDAAHIEAFESLAQAMDFTGRKPVPV